LIFECPEVQIPVPQVNSWAGITFACFNMSSKTDPFAMQVYFKRLDQNGFSKKKNHESAKTYSKTNKLDYSKRLHQLILQHESAQGIIICIEQNSNHTNNQAKSLEYK
jgi:hypothetical protein